MIQRRGAATFHPKIITKDVLGNDILYGEWHACNQFKSQMTNCYWSKVAAPYRWITNFLFPSFVYSNNLKFHIKIFFHSPLKRMIHPSFTLFQFFLIDHSPFKRVIHPFGGWFTLTEGWFTLKGECVHPFWRVNLLLRDPFTLLEGWMEEWIGWITLQRVNGCSQDTL